MAEPPERGVGVRSLRTRVGAVLRRVAAVLVVPVLAGVVIWFGVSQLGPSLRAASHHGTPGTYLVTDHSCAKSCYWSGTFTSDDGTVVRSYVGFRGHAPDGTRAGDRLPALDTGGFDVYSAGGNLAWLLYALVLAAGLAVLVGWGRLCLRAIRRRHEPRPAPPLGYSLMPLRLRPTAPTGRRLPRRAVAAGVIFAVLPLVTLGLGTALAFGFAALLLGGIGRRAAIALWVSTVGFGAATVYFFLDTDHPAGSAGDDLAVAALLLTVFGGFVVALFCAPWVAERVAGGAPGADAGEVIEEVAEAERVALEDDVNLRHAVRQRERRRLARQIVAEDPALAATLAIGRPDLDRDFVDGGLIDVNHVPAWVLADLPGFSTELAERVVAARTRLDRLLSGADLVVHADVPADLVDALRDVLVFPASAPRR